MSEMHWIEEVFMGLGMFSYIIGVVACFCVGAFMRDEGHDTGNPAERTRGAWIILGCLIWPVVAIVSALAFMVGDIRKQRRESTKTPFLKDLFRKP